MSSPAVPIDESHDETPPMAVVLREYAERLETVVEEWLDDAQHYAMAQEVRSLARGLRVLSESALADQRRAAAVRHRV